MKVLKIGLGLIVVILGFIIFDKFKGEGISLEKERFMDTIFVDNKAIELDFNEYILENESSNFSGSKKYAQLGEEFNGYNLYFSNGKAIGVDATGKKKLFEIDVIDLAQDKSYVEGFTNVLGHVGVKFVVTDGNGERALYFYNTDEDNQTILLADEFNATELFLTDDTKSLVTENAEGFVDEIITEDTQGIVKKATVLNDDSEDAYKIKLDEQETTFISTKLNKHGYTQNSIYLYDNMELVPVEMLLTEVDESEEEVESTENSEILAYPYTDDLDTSDFVTSDGRYVENRPEIASVNAKSRTLSTTGVEPSTEENVTFFEEENFNIANRTNSRFESLTGFVDEKYNDGYTYEYFKINEDYYAVKNIELNSYCFINADGAEVTSFKFYNEPQAFGEYIFVQDDKESYFLDGNLEKVAMLPSIKGYHDIKSYDDVVVLTSLLADSKKIFANIDGELLHESNTDEYITKYDYDMQNEIVEDSEIEYTLATKTYNSNFKYKGQYKEITGIGDIIIEEELNFTLKKLMVDAVDKYQKDTDAENLRLNNYYAYQQITIESGIFKVTQIENVKRNDELLSRNENIYYFDSVKGTQIFIENIFKKGYEERVLEELNYIAKGDFGYKVTFDINEIGDLDLRGDLFVNYEMGELDDSDKEYSFLLPLENLTDVIDFKSDAYKFLSGHSRTFAGVVPNETRSLIITHPNVTKDGMTITLYPQFISTTDDIYGKINKYYLDKYTLENTSSEILAYNDVDIFASYINDGLLQVSITKKYESDKQSIYYENDLWNTETGDKLDLYSLFNLEKEETAEFLDETIYEGVKVEYEALIKDTEDFEEKLKNGELNKYQETINSLYTQFTKDGVRVSEVGKRAIDKIDFNNDWYLTADGLVLVFQEYDLGGKGSQYMMLIPYEKLDGHLNENLGLNDSKK